MFIKSLRLVNFKNIEDETFSEWKSVNGIFGRNGSGKCVVGDSLILTNKGFSYIKDYSNNILGFSDKKVNILTKKGFVDSDRFYENTVDKTIKVISNKGFELEFKY